jgi:hypothetical protein
MAYIGNQGGTQNFRKCDAITTSATATFNLLVGGVAVNPAQNQTIVSLNGVIQSSGDSYTIASSQITFASTLASSDVIDFILILGDTLNVGTPSDATVSLAKLTASGTKDSTTYLRGDNTFATVSGTTLTGSTNNQVTTVTGANAITGETNLTYNGTILGAGATGASADLGVGIHVRTADSGGTANTNADELVLENGSSSCGIEMLCGDGQACNIMFGDAGDNDVGRIAYEHGDNSMRTYVNASEAMRIHSDGNVAIGTTVNEARVVMITGANTPVLYLEQSATSGYGSFMLKLSSGQNTTDGSYNLIEAQNGGGTKFRVADNGNVTNTNNSYGSLSDERIKQDITDANSQWDDIKALKVRNFKLKQEPTKSQLGVIAQDLETAGMNGLVVEAKPNKEDVAYHSDFGTVVEGTADNGATPIKDDDGNITGYEDVFTEGQKVKSVKYSVLYMKAIKALQESMERIETLEAKVTALENA